MPGLPLTGEYQRPEAPRILYASAGADRDGAEATEATAPGADAVSYTHLTLPTKA